MIVPTWYRIRVEGHLDPTWSMWFDGLNITHDPNGETVLCGLIMDQAELFGVLAKVHNLNLILVSVTRTSVESKHQASEANSPL